MNIVTSISRLRPVLKSANLFTKISIERARNGGNRFSTTTIRKNQAELRPSNNGDKFTKNEGDQFELGIKDEHSKVDVTVKESVRVDKGIHSEEKAASQQLTMTARFKKMYKEYWYVLLPVHIGTSSIWLGGFYYLSTSGVDIPALLESMHFSETVISKLRDSSMGHVAITYMCYKIATPLRYTLTLGSTTLAIKYLSQWGYIRPVPSKEKLKRIYDHQKAKFHKKN